MSGLNPPISTRDHVLGEANARLTLVEYGDYECPFCASAQIDVHRLVSAFPKDIRLAFRNFPLTQAHPHAFLAATAAEAAARQGAFWRMHELLFANQDLLGPRGVIAMARELGLDLDVFQNDMSDEAVTAKVHDDFMSGVRSGVNGTPSFFVNGEKFEGRLEVATFRRLLAEESGEQRI